ncbi:MAG: diaminopimelate epimerase [Bryobacteraceae bacterium]|nr:diaminopimelate epimerase [Bryobacteraceae bacterium]
MRIPFTKAHGARNDFLLTWAQEAPFENFSIAARSLCDRHSGVGADGWIIVNGPEGRSPEYHASIRLFNSDGSAAEISGNGTRCAAAFLIDSGLEAEEICIRTGAGLKYLRLIEKTGFRFVLEMKMGVPRYHEEDIHFILPLASGSQEVTILDVGNPQCAVLVEDLEAIDWRRLGAELERHPHFPNRTNVSFIQRVDEHTIEARFYERGAGETESSGTGSSGAAAAAILRNAVKSPVRVLTPGGPLEVSWDGELRMIGPAEIVAGGEFYF